MLVAKQPAPENYYQNNVLRVVEFVLERYDGIAPAALVADLRGYLQASQDSQRLFARLLTRKGPVFDQGTLGYREVADSEAALAELEDRNLVRSQGPIAADLLLNLILKDQLKVAFPLACSGLRTQPKPALVAAILHQYSDEQIRRHLSTFLSWVEITSPLHWQIVKILFFGNGRQDWSVFVRQDLEQVRYARVPLTQAQFDGAERLEAHLKERAWAGLSYRLDEYPQLLPWLVGQCCDTAPAPFNQPLRNRTLHRLGRWCERSGLFDFALAVYGAATTPPARERVVRILSKTGARAAAEAVLNDIRRAPLSATEAVFAKRFGQRNAGFQPKVEVMDIETVPPRVEDYALQEILAARADCAQQAWGMHSENALVKTLTGLLYWPVIFAPVPGAFTNPFQLGPHDLFEDSFVSLRAPALFELEQQTADDAALLDHLDQVVKAHQGTANHLVSWGLIEQVGLDTILTAMGPANVRQLCSFLIKNLADYRRGFPDLFVAYGIGDFEFIEVKGPNDQLQPGQRAWLQQFSEMGMRAKVLRLQLTA